MKKGLFIKKIFSKKSIKKIENKIGYLGIDNKIDINNYLNIKLLLLVIIFVFTLIYFEFGYILAVVFTFAFYYLYDYVLLDLKIKKRIDILEHDAIFFFEVLAITLQSHNNLKLCLEITSDAIDSELSKEVKDVLKNMKIGKSLDEVLNDLKDRIPSKSVGNVILNIIEANHYGNPIVDSLNNQVSYLTDKRILDIKAKINKMPTKISIISVVLFIPLVMLLILGPVIINYFFS